MVAEGSVGAATPPTRVLLVDDDFAVLKVYQRLLAAAGNEVAAVADGQDALAALRARSFEVVVSDIAMPGLDGLQLLRAMRSHDLDVPVILMTGSPGGDSALQALEFGAYRYLLKPVEPGALVAAVARAARFHQLARLKRTALDEMGDDGGHWLGDRASLEARFESAVTQLWIAFQPVVSWKNRRLHGYEALVRTNEPLLARAENLLKAAERLGRVTELGSEIRRRVAAAARSAPAGTLFVNVHALELQDPDLASPASPLSSMAENVVLEVTERTSLGDIEAATKHVAAVRRLGFRLAVDDVGAGYAGLTSFAILEPEVAKLDMTLVRGIDTSPIRQTIVRSMYTLCRELEVQVIAEGVETVAERQTLQDLGADLMQGFLFARPDRGFPSPLF